MIRIAGQRKPQVGKHCSQIRAIRIIRQIRVLLVPFFLTAAAALEPELLSGCVSFHQAGEAEGAEQEAVEGVGGQRADQRALARGAEAVEGFEAGGEFALVGLAEVGGDVHAADVGGFDVDPIDAAPGGGIDFVGGEDLNGAAVDAGEAEAVERAAEVGAIEEVAEDHCHASSGTARRSCSPKAFATERGTAR